ncbi:MAG TPA: hypothetical protein VKU19_14285 [Bryobacteraceae bacterium]|nr:hypothetical protein [Bryobacteraceae bacterium]
MRFAKLVFWIAGGWGLAAIVPLYFLYDTIGRMNPPTVTHPEFFYGFAGVALVWQIAFFVIGYAPDRLRPMMIPAVFEKLGYVLMLVVLCLRNQITPAQTLPVIPDGLLGILFAVAYRKTGRGDARP